MVQYLLSCGSEIPTENGSSSPSSQPTIHESFFWRTYRVDIFCRNPGDTEKTTDGISSGPRTANKLHFWILSWHHLPCICNSMELQPVIVHGICYIFACSPSILHGICYTYVWHFKHGICYMLVVQTFMRVSLGIFRVSFRVSLWFLYGFI